MANFASKVIAIALAEEGYLEKSAAAWSKYGKDCLYNKTAYAGSDNYTKYGYEMHQIYPSVMDFPAYWCDCFVDWCFQQAYGTSNAKKLLGGDFDDYTKNSINLYKSKKAFFLRGEKTPLPGDQVFFTKDGTFAGVHHTALVIEVKNGYIYTIEGNTGAGSAVIANGGGVARKTYLMNSKTIYGYGRPPYDPEETEIKNLVEYPVSTGAKGVKIVGTASLNCRASYSTSSAIITTLAKGTYVKPNKKVNVNGTWWFYLPDKNGWISGKYIEGWLQEANNKWWYVMENYTYPYNIIKTIESKDYIFDKDGWMVTSNRINSSGVLTY